MQTPTHARCKLTREQINVNRALISVTVPLFSRFYGSCEDRRAGLILPTSKSFSCSASSGQVLGMKHLTATVPSACRLVMLKPTSFSKGDSDQLTEQKLSIINPLRGSTFLSSYCFLCYKVIYHQKPPKL